MPVYDSLHWLTFLAAAALLNLSPGPDIAFILGKTAQGGRRAGLAAMLGVWAGTFGQVMAAALGLSAILVSSALAFTTIKWVGAAYLIWLGIRACARAGAGSSAASRARPISGRPSARGCWSTC